jgi:hypothetical protein
MNPWLILAGITLLVGGLFGDDPPPADMHDEERYPAAPAAPPAPPAPPKPPAPPEPAKEAPPCEPE